MVDKEIHVCAVIFDILCEYIGIGGFEHQLIHADLIDEFCRYVRAPRIDILGDSFTLDHDNVGARFKESLRLRNRPVRIACAFCLQFRGRCCAASAKLNSNFRLPFNPDLRTNSVSRSQSSVEMEMNPAEISIISNPSLSHSATYCRTASLPWASTCSRNPPVETRARCDDDRVR